MRKFLVNSISLALGIALCFVFIGFLSHYMLRSQPRYEVSDSVYSTAEQLCISDANQRAEKNGSTVSFDGAVPGKATQHENVFTPSLGHFKLYNSDSPIVQWSETVDINRFEEGTLFNVLNMNYLHTESDVSVLHRFPAS